MRGPKPPLIVLTEAERQALDDLVRAMEFLSKVVEIARAYPPAHLPYTASG